SSLNFTAQELRQLRMVKVKVLEIVWSYLYSAREQEAWHTLSEMWPSVDIDRIHSAILNARTHGIHSQADTTSSGPLRNKKKDVHVFDAVNMSRTGNKLEVVPPKAILLQRQPVPNLQDQKSPTQELLLDLVVDQSGKVRSAEPAGKVKWADPELINAALTWK